MHHFATGKSDAALKYGVGFQPFVLDNKLRVFILVDGVVNDALNQAMADKMIGAVHQVLTRNHRYLDSYARVPSYANRIRASMLMDLALNQTKRALQATLNDAGNDEFSELSSSIIPSLTIIAMGNYSALIAFGTNSGVYHVRKGSVRFLTIDDAKASRGAVTTAAKDSSSIRDSSSSTITGPGGEDDGTRTFLMDLDIQPGDHFLIASNGLISDVAKGRQLAELLKDDNTADILGKLVDHASEVVRDHLISGILIKSLGVPRDPAFVAKFEPLKKIPLFRKLNEPELKKLLPMLKLHSLDRGQNLPYGGEEDRSLYLIVAGKIEVFQGANRIGEISSEVESTQFGFLNHWPRDVRFLATKPTKILTIANDYVRWLRDNEPVIATKLFWEVLAIDAIRARATKTARVQITGDSSRVGSIPSRPDSRMGDDSEPIRGFVDESSRKYTQSPSRIKDEDVEGLI